MSNETSRHGPREPYPTPEQQEDDLKAWRTELMGEGENAREIVSQSDFDRGEADAILAATQRKADEDNAAREVDEAAARVRLQEIQSEIPSWSAALDQREAEAREHPENEFATAALSQLEVNIMTLEPGKQRTLIDPSDDDELHRKITQKVFAELGFDDPIPELMADNRSRIRKLLRPTNRKVTQVRHDFIDRSGEKGFVRASRVYHNASKTYLLRLDGGPANS